MRLFIALPLPRDVEEALGKLIFVLKQKAGRIKWVAPKNIHLTVKFLGEVSEDKLENIKSAVGLTAGKYSIVESTIDRVGAFPDLTRPRVIWAGMNGGTETLDRLVGEIEDEMARLGFVREEKRFKPHITLGRVKESSGLSDLTAFMKNYHMSPTSLRLDTLVLFKSTLTPRGPLYDRLFEAKLKK